MIDRNLCDLLEPGVQALGFELLTVELSGRGNSSVVRVYIDGPDGITVDDCARVSGQVGAILDVEDPIPNRYTLEVSSPGFDRPLCKPSHFEAALDRRVKIQTRTRIDGRKRFSGVLRGVTDAEVTIEVDGTTYTVPMDQIARARLVPDFRAEAGRSGH